jgi:dihydrofolate reductase
MGKLIVTENVTLDGVMQDPTGEEGSAVGGWFGQISDRDAAGFAEVLSAEAQAAAAMLLGHRSYEWFARRWTTRAGAWADRLRSLPKYVVGREIEDRGWGAAPTALSIDEVPAVKEKVDGDIVVNASGGLVPTLLAQGLVDELRLLVFPYVLGQGDRLFRPATGRTALRLTGNRTIGDSLLLLTYATV